MQNKVLNCDQCEKSIREKELYLKQMEVSKEWIRIQLKKMRIITK